MTTLARPGNIAEDVAIKAPVRVASTGSNLVLSGLQTIDDNVLVDGDRVLLMDQDDATQNGIWNASTGNWTRSYDVSKNTDYINGTLVFVAQGTVNAGLIFAVITTVSPIVIGETEITFLEQSNVAAAKFQASSSTSTTIALGSKTFAIQEGKSFRALQFVLVYSLANPANIMLAQISGYVGTNLSFNVIAVGGAGAFSDWIVVLTGSPNAAGFMPPVGTGNVSALGSATVGHVATFADPSGLVIQDAGPLGDLSQLNDVTAAFLDPSVLAGGATMVNGTIVESHAAGAATYALKTLAGVDPSVADPVFIIFRHATPSLGGYVVKLVTTALSITVPSGATLGALNATPFRLWITAFNDGGTVRLAVINCLSGVNIYPLGQFPIASTSLTPGNLPQVFYTTGAAVTAKAYAVLGYASYESGIATAGTWNVSPTWLQLFGPSVPLPGSRFPTQSFFTGAQASGTTAIPDDDTIPQNTEGDQYLSLQVTPSSAANLLFVETQQHITNTSNSHCSSALFRDSVVDALVATRQNIVAAGAIQESSLKTIVPAKAVTPTTFKLRSGSGGGTTTFNGNSAGRLFGGALNSFIQVTEIQT